MLVKILAFFDLLGVFMLILSFFNIQPLRPLIGVATFFITKFIIFQDVASFLDALVGVYLVFMIFGLSSTFLTVLSCIYLLQKIVFSFLG